MRLSRQNSKIFFCAALIMMATIRSSQAAFLAPVADGVNDFANALTENRKNQIKDILMRVESQTGVEIALVTVKSLSDYKESPSRISSFSKKLFNQWGIGHKALNNGVLILVSINDKQIRFEFGSDYNEKEAAALKKIVRKKVLPYFSKAEYSEGLFASTMYAIQEVTTSISFWEFYQGAIFIWVLCLGSLGICLYGYGKQNKKLAGLSFAAAGIFLVILVVNLAKNSGQAGFGGGATTGVGITERW